MSWPSVGLLKALQRLGLAGVENLSFPTTAGLLAAAFGAKLLGNADSPVDSLAPLSAAMPGTLSFCASKKYGAELARAQGGVLFIHEDLVREDLPLTFLIVADPQKAFAEVAKGFRALSSPAPGVSPLASVHPGALLEEGVAVGAFAVIGEHSCIGRGTVVHPHATIGGQVVIGENCEVHPQVVIWDRVRIGNRVKVFAGSVIGSEGFGYIGSDTGHEEMPQVGSVVIEDDVRVGAKCTIDRATLGVTRIGRGTKIDDQVHVGHNCNVGERVLLCAQVGLGGSVTLEDEVILGGQAGIGHGVRIGKKARLGGQAGSSTNLKGDETYFLTPAVPVEQMVKMVRYTRKLPRMWDRLKAIEAKLGLTDKKGDASE